MISTISIAMATYNGGKYLNEQLVSFINQKKLPDELVVCDDGSTDNTIEILKDFKRISPFPVLIFENKVRQGYGQNFGRALIHCSGDLVFLSDQDDVWFENKIILMFEMANSISEKFLFMNDAVITDSLLNTKSFTKIEQIKFSGLGLNSFVQGSCCAIRREILDIAIPLPKEIEAHDNWIVKIARFLNLIHVNAEVLQYYRLHGDNTSNYLINSLTKMSRVSRLLSRMKRREDLFIEFLSELKFTDKIYNRLINNKSSEVIKLIGKNNLNNIKNTLDERKYVIQKRIEIENEKYLSNLFKIVKLLVSGKYHRHFNGFTSFLGDLTAI